jgi:nucleoside-triphosphatase
LTSRIFLTGPPGVGKTTVLRKTVEELRRNRIRVAGMITEEVREHGARVGFKVTDILTGNDGWLASTRRAVGPRIGKYVVDLEGLEVVGVQAITGALHDPEVSAIVIDEVGPMELLSEKFKMAVRQTINSTKAIVGTIHYRANDPLLQEIRSSLRLSIVTVTVDNRSSLPQQLVEEITNQGGRQS